MKPIQKILVPLDHEHLQGSTAPGRAARLAARFGASLTLVGVVPELPWFARLAMTDPEGVERAVLNEERHQLERVAQPIRDQGVEVEVRALRGRPPLEIVREAIRGGHDLLIKDAGSGTEGTFLSADRQILRTCPCPVWLLKSSPSDGAKPRERVLALVDPTPLGSSPATDEERRSISTMVLDLAATLSEAEGSELLVAHVWDAAAQGLLRNCGYTEEQITTYVENVKKGVSLALERLMERYRGRIDPSALRLLRGMPTTVIPEFVAREQIDVIVMGTMARSGIAGMVIGNTAESILGRSPCSILAVKPEGFVSPVELDGPAREAEPSASGH